MSEETLILIDDRGVILGEALRKQAHREGFLHSIVVIYLFDNEGKILVQQRMDGRFDHSAAGHVAKGETYEQTAVRELGEELGVSGAKLTELGKSFSREIHPERDEDINHVFKIYGCKAKPGQLQEAEVRAVFWADPHEIQKAIQQDPDEKYYTGGFRESLAFILRDAKYKDLCRD